MFFKDIKPESSIYVYNRQTNTLDTARVVSVSPPYYDNNFSHRQSASYDNYNNMYVDMVLDIQGNVTPPYVCPEKSEIVYANNLVICPDIAPILREVESTKNQAEQQLANFKPEILKERINKCDNILAEYNPSFRKEKEIDNRINQIEGSVNEMKDMFRQFMNEWSGKSKS